jgi:hypothetical protein
MKIIFLDIDGVLNHDQWYISKEYQTLYQNEDNELDIDPKCAERINKICEQTGAKIVISSDWRISWYGTLMRLQRGGINTEYIIDKTPELLWIDIPGFDKSRGSEIETWVNFNMDINQNYVIIDDRTDFKPSQQEHFIHINPHCGITDEDMNKAINILNTNF